MKIINDTLFSLVKAIFPIFIAVAVMIFFIVNGPFALSLGKY